MNKELFFGLLAIVFIGLFGFMLVKSDTIVNVDSPEMGAFSGTDIYNEVYFHDGLKNLSMDVTTKAPTSQYSTTTLVAGDSGSTFFLSASGTLMTLPSVADGLNFKFVVGDALDTANVVIDSAEGDNIEGSLIVAGAVVECDAEDQINIVIDGEDLGDFVELYSNGSKWFIGSSNALTAGKMTCTDPS